MRKERREEVENVDESVLVESIRSAISKSGMKQKAVAERIGFTEQMLTDMLNGRKVIKAEFIPALCAVLDMTPNQLFRWPEK